MQTRAHGGQPINPYTGYCLANKGKATAPDNVYNPEDGPEAYTNPSVHSRISEYTEVARSLHGSDHDPST